MDTPFYLVNGRAALYETADDRKAAAAKSITARTLGNMPRREAKTRCRMPSVPLHSGSTRTSAPVASPSWQYLAGSSVIPTPWRAAAIKMSKLPLARRGSTGTLLISPFSAVRCQMPPLCSSCCKTGKLARSDGDIGPVVNEVDPAIGGDALKAQSRVGGKETRQGIGDGALKSERAAQSNKPPRFALPAKRGFLGGLSLDHRRARMFEDLLADLGQAEASRGSIAPPHSEPPLQQSDAPADA